MSTTGPQTPRKKLPRLPPRSPGTPRRRPPKSASRLQGTSPAKLTYAEISAQLITLLALTFVPELWQVYLISRILRGFDSIFLAGTGYGKSLIFEGLAALGGKKKVVIVVCPLKALERDQVNQARKKGINAILINEDNTKNVSLWKEARTTAQLVYISPEMANSDSFFRLWKDSKFRTRITALIVDEAHCIHDWGDEFRPEYKKLEMLRSYTGLEVPIVACTATAATPTFNTIWNSLGFGNRPFWGLDVWCDRPNLLYLTRTISNPQNPVLDLLNLLPETLDEHTPSEAIDKMLIYFDSEKNCVDGINTLREALPAHLRDCVYNFSGSLSEDAKVACWNDFTNGRYRIICCTEAAGMGCNVPDVKIVVIVAAPKVPKSPAVVTQRWGRNARGRGTIGTCIMLVPKWAFRPAQPEMGSAVQRLRAEENLKVEPKTHTTSRARLEPNVEAFINSGSADTPAARKSTLCLLKLRPEAWFEGCSHRFMARIFRPRTGLTTFTSLDATEPSVVGEVSQKSAYELSWTVINLPGKTPPKERCCGHCNPELLAAFHPSNNRDPRLLKFAAEFINPVAAEPELDLRPSSRASVRSDNSSASVATVEFAAQEKAPSVPKADKEALREQIVAWRTLRHEKRGGSKFISAEVALPPKQLDALVSSSGKFLTYTVIGKKQILTVVKKWDFATDDDFCDVAAMISEWRLRFVSTTLKSQHRSHKKNRTSSISVPAPPQPNFSAAARTRSRVPAPQTPVRIASTSRQPDQSPNRTPRGRPQPLDVFSSPAPASIRTQPSSHSSTEQFPSATPQQSRAVSTPRHYYTPAQYYPAVYHTPPTSYSTPIYYPPQSSVYQTPPITGLYHHPQIYPGPNSPATPMFVPRQPDYTMWATQPSVLPPAFPLPPQHTLHPDWAHTAPRPYHSAMSPPTHPGSQG